MEMLIRFVIARLDPLSGRRQGLFEAGAALRRTGAMTAADLERLNSARDWFWVNLPVPTRFSVSRRPHATPLALSWFRDSAGEHVSRIREYQHVLEAYGEQIDMLRTKRPGYVVYEDDYQVVAYPYADTPC